MWWWYKLAPGVHCVREALGLHGWKALKKLKRHLEKTPPEKHRKQDRGQSGEIIKERQKEEEGSSPKAVTFALLSKISKISMRTNGKDISDPGSIMGPWTVEPLTYWSHLGQPASSGAQGQVRTDKIIIPTQSWKCHHRDRQAKRRRPEPSCADDP